MAEDPPESPLSPGSAPSPGTALGGVYDRAAAALSRSPQTDPTAWARLAALLDPAEWRPKRAADVVEQQADGAAGSASLVLHSPESDEYLPLGPEDVFVWQCLDGEQSVRDIEVAYLGQFGTVGTKRIAVVLSELKAGGFLDEPAESIYDMVGRAFAVTTAEGRLQKAQAGLARRRLWRLEDNPRVAAWLGRLSPLAGNMWVGIGLAVLSVVGILAFIHLFGLETSDSAGRAGGSAAVSFVKIFGSYLFGVIVLLAANVALSAFNEFASAAALKARGGRVPRFDIDLRYGLPVCTADLRQVCLLPVRGRVEVLLFGGLVELALAGVLSLLALLLPNNLCFNLAALCYVRVFASLCPWFNTRGYRAGVEWLNMPELRGEAIALFRTRWWREAVSICLPVAAAWFVLRPFTPAAPGHFHWRGWVFALAAAAFLVYMFRQGRRRVPSVAEPEAMGRAEQAYAGFLLAGLVWTILLVWGCVGAMASDVFQEGYVADFSGAWLVTKVFMLLLVALPVLFVAAFLAATVALLLVYGWQWVVRSEFWRSPERVATALWVASAAIAFGPLLAGPAAGWLRSTVVLVAGVCVASCVVLSLRSGASRPRRDAMALAAFAGLVLVGTLPSGIESHCLLAAYVALVVLGVLRLRDDRPSGARLWAVGTVAGACLFGLVPATKTFYLLPIWWPEATAALVGAWASAFVLAAFAPWLLDRAESRSNRAAAMLAAAMAALGVANVLVLGLLALQPMPMAAEEIPFHAALARSVEVFGLALMASAVYLYHHIVSTVRLEVPTVAAEGESDLARVRDAFRLFAATVLADVSSICGPAAAAQAQGAFNGRAKELAWGIAVCGGTANLTGFNETELSSASDTLHAAVQALADVARRVLGDEALERTVVRVYDHLPWESRELATTYLFRDTRWAENLAGRPVVRHDELAALLRDMLIFKDLSPADMAALCRRFGVERFRPGRAIVEQGDEGDRFYVIQKGTVEVLLEGPTGPASVLAHLRNGEYFGEVALLERCPRTATVRATTDTSAYVLQKADFDRFVESAGEAGAQVVETIANVRRMRHVPIFRDLPESQIALLISQLKTERLAAGTDVFSQGDAGDKFYVVREGQVSIIAARDLEAPQEVATLGPGEYFGEIALLCSVPRTATARAKADTELWVLEGDDFKRLMQEERVAVGTLQQTASRRLFQLKRRVFA